jgi:hypothetical protein
MKKLLGALAAIVLAALMMAPAGAQGAKATITLMHGIPNTPVDVEVGGANVFTNFNFGEMKDLSSLAGQTLKGLKVKAAGTSTVAIDAGDVALPASGNYTAIAHLDATGKPKLTVFANDTSMIASGKGRLVVRHTAAAPAVDVKANGTTAFANLTNPNEAKADLAVGTISATVTPAGAATPVVIGPADLAIKDGTSLIVYAVGSLDGKTLGVLTQSIAGLGGASMVVNTGNSPVGESSSNTLTVALGAAALVSLLGAGSVLAVRRVKG